MKDNPKPTATPRPDLYLHLNSLSRAWSRQPPSNGALNPSCHGSSILAQHGWICPHSQQHSIWHQCETQGLPWWLSGKESACDAGDMGDTGSIRGLGRSHGEGNGNPFQCSCLENTTDRAPGELQSVGLQRVGHNWSDIACTYTHGIQMLSVIVGHHSRRFQCSAWELEGNRAERASEMTNGFSACQHRFYWHLEWTKPSRDQVAFQDFSIRGPQPLAPPYTATVWNAAPQHSRGPRKDIAKPGPEPLTWSITEGREGGHLPRPPKKLDVS